MARPTLHQSPLPALAALLAVAALGLGRGPSLEAASEVLLLARPEVGTLDGMRAVSRLGAAAPWTYRDESAVGLRVGTGPAEVRMAVAKPAFVEPVEKYRGWQVVDVDYQIGGCSAVLSTPLMYWASATPASMIWSLPTTDVSTSYLLNLFQTLISGGGNYSLTTGVVLRGTERLATARPVELNFLVTVRDPSPFIVDAFSLLQQPQTGAYLLSWRSTRRGYADVYVNSVRRVADQFTVAMRVNRNIIYRDWLQSGTNTVQVFVREPENPESVGESAALTISQ